MIYLVFHTLTLPSSGEYLISFLKPDLSKLTPKNIFAGMGQAFFSLSLGGTMLVIYGSYVKKKENIPKLAIFTGIGDLSAALLASLFIVPTVLLYGLNLEEGYTLLFSTIPIVFQKLPMGRILGTFFLLSLFFIAFLSTVAALQLLSGTLANNTRLGKKKSIIIVGIADLFLMIPCAFFPQIIPKLDLIAGSGMQVFGSAIAMIALTRGFGKIKVVKQIFRNDKGKFKSVYFFWLKWIIPLALFLTLILYIYGSLDL
jgi:NSS family neurotransmitter:Na+ symporter